MFRPPIRYDAVGGRRRRRKRTKGGSGFTDFLNGVKDGFTGTLSAAAPFLPMLMGAGKRHKVGGSKRRVIRRK